MSSVRCWFDAWSDSEYHGSGLYVACFPAVYGAGWERGLPRFLLQVVQSGVMALPCVRLGAVQLRAGAFIRSLCRSSSHNTATTAEEIDIPKRKTWDKTAVLQALAYTVNHDPTSAQYAFQDDPYLIPTSNLDFKYHLLSKESGKNAAKYIVNLYPHLFQKDIAEPHIPCFMPEDIHPQIEGISEEALNERIKLRRVKESLDLFDQLIQNGTTPTLETTNKLLDLLCFYGDCEPTTDDQHQQHQLEDESGNVHQKTLPARQMWRQANNAERIFNLMPERNARSFCTMIRGMVKHRAYTEAFTMYTDLLNNRYTGDVHTFNALILAVPYTTKERRDKVDQVLELLKHMVEQKVTPNLLTFNSVLKSLNKIGTFLQDLAMQTFMELKALNIEPSLATYKHLLDVFNSNLLQQSFLLSSILNLAQGKSFTIKDPDDVLFFGIAIKLCLKVDDLDMAYELHKLLNTGDNWKLMGKNSTKFFYYDRLFSLVCRRENADIVLKWYREMVPSHYFPTVEAYQELLQVIEMENRLEVIPELWKDMKRLIFGKRKDLLELVLTLLASEKQNAELQATFADIAASIYSVYETSETANSNLKASAFGNVAILLTRAGRLEEAWKIMQSFKTQHLVPQSTVVMILLDAAKAAGNKAVAIDLVQLAVSFSLPNTVEMAQKVLHDFSLTEEQRITLQDLTQSNGESMSSSSSSDSDHE